jgi:hypothetical protein
MGRKRQLVGRTGSLTLILLPHSLVGVSKESVRVLLVRYHLVRIAIVCIRTTHCPKPPLCKFKRPDRYESQHNDNHCTETPWFQVLSQTLREKERARTMKQWWKKDFMFRLFLLQSYNKKRMENLKGFWVTIRRKSSIL